MQFHAIAMSDQGLVRRNNEDNFYFNGRIREREELLGTVLERMPVTNRSALFVVCDGMGGEALGEEASRIGVAGIKEIEALLSQDEEANFEHLMYSYLNSANDKICEEMRRNKGLRMGTTFAALWLHEETAQTINLGDSRVYLIRRGVSYQLTRDHTHAQRLVDIGIINREEAEQHPERHRLMQHLGLFPEERSLKPAISARFWLENHDRLLLCSDGVTDMVPTDKLIALIEKYPNIEEAGRKLMKKVLHNGGKDNVTFILIAIDAVSDEAKQGIREATGVLAEPPKWPINTELDGDTKELPAMPVRTSIKPLTSSDPSLIKSDTSVSTPSSNLVENDSPSPEDLDRAKESELNFDSEMGDQVRPRRRKSNKPEQFLEDHDGKTNAQEEADSFKDEHPNGVGMPSTTSMDQIEEDHFLTPVPDSIYETGSAEEGVNMKRPDHPNNPGIRSPQTELQPFPASRPETTPHQIRAPRMVDYDGHDSSLTEADLERFHRAREQAKVRQQMERESGQMAFPEELIDGRDNPRGNTEQDDQVKRSRRQSRQASADDIARRKPRHNVGRERVILTDESPRRNNYPKYDTDRDASYMERRRREPHYYESADDRDMREVGRRSKGRRKRRGGFWRNLVFFLIFVALGFAIGWIVLNLGRFI